MSKTVAIIGAGYGGLALANLLAKAGYSVTIYERNQSPGGRAGVVRQDGFTFDTGPSWYLMPEVFAQYYALFGLSSAEELSLIRLRPGYRVFFESAAPITIAGDLETDAETFESIELGAGQKLYRYVERSQKIYDLSVKHFLYTNFQRIRELLHPEILRGSISMLGFMTKTIDRYVSHYFNDLRLKQILQYHMVFLGSSPFQAPAMYSLMSTLDFKSGVFYPKRGMYSLVESQVALGERLGVRYEYGADVEKIVVENDVATGLELRGGRTILADIIVSNADLHFTETALLASEHQSFSEAYWKRRQPGPSALLISLGVRGELPQLLHHNLFFVDDWRENFKAIYEDYAVPDAASLYVCNPTKTDRNVGPESTENLFILVPLPAGLTLSADEKTTLTARFIEQFARMAGAPDLAERIITQYVYGPDEFTSDFHSWLGGALGGQSHLLSQSALFRTPNKSRKVENLYYVGAGTRPGIGLPMCLIGAQLTYKRIRGIRAGGPLIKEELA